MLRLSHFLEQSMYPGDSWRVLLGFHRHRTLGLLSAYG